MQLLRFRHDEFPQPCVATIGFFDGIHLGHRYLIKQVCEIADQRGYKAAVVTFPVHPRQIVRYKPDFKLLTTWEEKLSILSDSGLDYCIALDFTEKLAALSAKDFMLFLKNEFNVKLLLVGYDHRFGHNRSEGFPDYVRYGEELGIKVLLNEVYKTDENEVISSSLIRNSLLLGKVSDAAKLLGYYYYLEGIVVSGRQLGRQIGYPTANLKVGSPDKVIPADGVYAVWVTIDGKKYGGMLSIGVRPTVNNGTDRTIETHIFNFDSDIYGKTIRISFVSYIRLEEKFGTIDELIAQLHKDAEVSTHILEMAT